MIWMQLITAKKRIKLEEAGAKCYTKYKQVQNSTQDKFEQRGKFRKAHFCYLISFA